MSLAVTALIWEHFEEGGSVLLLALALGDYCGDDEGTRIFPSVAQLARKTRLDRRTVQRLLRRLEECKWLQRVGPEPKGRGQAQRYRIDPAFMEKGGKLPPFSRGKGGIQSTKGGNGAALTEGTENLKGKNRCSSCDAPGVTATGSRWYCRGCDPMRKLLGIPM